MTENFKQRKNDEQQKQNKIERELLYLRQRVKDADYLVEKYNFEKFECFYYGYPKGYLPKLQNLINDYINGQEYYSNF